MYSNGQRMMLGGISGSSYPFEIWAHASMSTPEERVEIISNRGPGSSSNGLNIALSVNKRLSLNLRDEGPPVMNTTLSSGFTMSVRDVARVRMSRQDLALQNKDNDPYISEFSRVLGPSIGGSEMMLGPRSSNKEITLKHLFFFDRELTEAEANILMRWMEAQM